MPVRPEHHLSPAETGWQSYPGELIAPRPHEAHVWRLLNADQQPDAAVWRLLHEDERRRAGRFRFGRDRHVYVHCRARLRALLATYLKLHPADIEFNYGPHGKPALVSSPAKPLAFNVSHSRGAALLAFGGFTDLGVDLEWEDRSFDPAAIVSRYFTPVESTDILAAGRTKDKYAAFYRAWTRKEAFIKAIGNGLAAPLNQFGVSVDRRVVRLTHIDWPDDDPADFSLVGFDVRERLPGALCVRGRLDRIHFFTG